MENSRGQPRGNFDRRFETSCSHRYVEVQFTTHEGEREKEGRDSLTARSHRENEEPVTRLVATFFETSWQTHREAPRARNDSTRRGFAALCIDTFR